VYTNLANDKSFTAVTNAIEKDLRVTDNGDGTLTILVLSTGNAVLYGEDGKAIARNRVSSGSRSSSITAARRPIRPTTSFSPS
jgi:hypothetical protein